MRESKGQCYRIISDWVYQLIEEREGQEQVILGRENRVSKATKIRKTTEWSERMRMEPNRMQGVFSCKVHCKIL